MNAKILTITAIILLCFAVLTGCISAEERQRGKEIEAVAGPMAINYIAEKYGFDAEITNVRLSTRTSGLPSPENTYYTNQATVTCKHHDKTFSVAVDVGTDMAADDYQYEEIERDLIAFIQNAFSRNSVVVPQRVELNRIVNSTNRDDWLQGFWDNDAFYDGDMNQFIDRVSSSAENARTLITLLFEIDAGDKDDVIQQLSLEAEQLQQRMANKGNITLLFYDTAAASQDAMEAIGELNNVHNRRWISHDEGYVTESFIKVYDYTHYSPAYDTGGWGEIAVCGYTVNGERFEEADRFSVSSTYDKDRWNTDATVLTSYFSYGNFYGNDSDWFPEHRYVRINLATLFPKEAAGRSQFVVLDAYDTIRSSGKPVATVPSLRIGDYLYFDCVRSHSYAIGVD